MNIVEPFVRQALAEPSRPAIVIAGTTVSYGQLLVHVRRLAARLLDLGVRPGERVAVSSGAAAGNVALTLAVAHIGATSVAIGAGTPPDSFARRVEQLGVNYIVHSWAQDLAAQAPSLKAQFRFEWLLETAPAPRDVEIADPVADAPWRIVLSSGTTGEPKGIALGHRSTMLNAHLMRGVFPVEPADRLLVGLNPNLGFATHYWLRCLHVGASIALMVSEDAREALQLLYGGAVTMMVTTPGLAMAMAMEVQKPDSTYVEPPRIKRLNVGGGKLSPQLRDVLRRRICGTLHTNYGATETSGVAFTDAQLQDKHPEVAGRLVPWAEAQAVDDDGKVLPAGQQGRLRFRTPTMALGYVGADAGEAAAFRDGWFYSNDVGAVTPHGYVVLAGRANDVINVMGNKLDPEQLEQVILRDPAILDCVVVDVPADLGQPVLAVVVVAPNGFDQDALVARCVAVSARYRPGLVVTSDAVPRNPSGKVMRAAVRQMLVEAQARERAQRNDQPTLH